MSNPSIVLTTLNARYTHTSLGLRCLYANMKELQSSTKIIEFTINENIQSIAENLLSLCPKIIGIGSYIWNATEVAELIKIIKKVAPNTIIILGGPEASYLPHRVDFSSADHIISGEGEITFYELCSDLLKSKFDHPWFIKATLPDLKSITLPYEAYFDEDIQHRYIYVEASRGCPFECEFCLSSIDEKVRNFPLDSLLESFEILWQKGARNFKFIDRTFNLNMSFANQILDFFLSKEPPYFAHFEVIPDHFPEVLKEKIALFPPGSLQLEIGIQTLDPSIAKGINRPLKIDKIVENLTFLQNDTHAHMHLDLIVGLPGETIEGFGKNLDLLYSITKSEIQIGILKNLSGTTLSRHDQEHGMIYFDLPPYDILQNNLLSFQTIQKMKRFARFWDIYYNSGNFPHTLELLLKGESVFSAFSAFSIWIYEQTLSTWKISFERQVQLLYDYLIRTYNSELVQKTLLDDLKDRPEKTIPFFLRQHLYINKKETGGPSTLTKKPVTPKRQQKRIKDDED